MVTWPYASHLESDGRDPWWDLAQLLTNNHTKWSDGVLYLVNIILNVKCDHWLGLLPKVSSPLPIIHNDSSHILLKEISCGIFLTSQNIHVDTLHSKVACFLKILLPQVNEHESFSLELGANCSMLNSNTIFNVKKVRDVMDYNIK